LHAQREFSADPKKPEGEEKENITDNVRERKSPYAVVVGRCEESHKLRTNKLRVVAETKGNERAVKDEQTIEQEEPTQKFTLRE